jgi:branched-chain amino acid transport system ATP-binding protein
MGTPLLNVSDLRAGYGKAEVLHGLSLQADRGSVITVIGPNGAGKSTLLNSLMGILPSKGRIEFDGQSIEELTLEERVMLGIALVPEKRELFGTMSVEDNLVLGGFRQMRMGNRQWRDRLDDVFELFPRLKERRAQEAGTLSGGERQMLASVGTDAGRTQSGPGASDRQGHLFHHRDVAQDWRHHRAGRTERAGSTGRG